MTDASPRRYRIVVGVDLSEYAEIVIEHALDQAARHASPELHFVYVEERRQRTAEPSKHRLSAAVFPALQTFNQFADRWRARLHIRRGRPADQIAMLAADVRADLIVIGQFGLHHRKLTLKGVPSRVLLAAPCPTLVVGMPPVLDAPQCTACATIRDRSDGDRWFCDDHVARSAVRAVSPMTEWSGGSPTR
jgi:nucleotide-binding universal stress UspA family protein